VQSDIIENKNKHFMFTISFFSMIWKEMQPIDCLVTHFLQNVFFFCIEQKKETHTGLEQLEVRIKNFG